MIMHDLNVSALWTVAGWTMLHFMWIGALVGSAAWMVRQTTRRLSPNIRYASTLALLALLATAPIAIAVRVGGAVIERRVSSVESLNADHGEAASAAVAPTEIIDLAQNPPPPSLGEGLVW